MKKTFRFLASLTLGFMIASCQNGLEEVINESEVQDELATTRAATDNVSIIPLTNSEEEQAELLAFYSTGPTINGSSIIGRYVSETYSFNNAYYGSHHYAWSYDTSRFSGDISVNKQITLTLTDETSTDDATLYLYFYDSSNNIIAISYINLGVNGPRLNSSTVRILRSSDGVEAYPSTDVRLEPNTFYYGYFNGISSVLLTDWDFNGHATWINNPSYPVYFKTDSQGWCFLDVYGYMPIYGVNKKLVSVTLYGQ